MRLENTVRSLTTTGLMETSRATIKASPKVFSMFETGTYTDIPLTICRELVANGKDSHTDAGCPERPVEVTLPTELDPTFKVRDFGTGMTHAFLMDGFMAYADGSTKDFSDDQIGGWGIGSKSPFGYVDQYTARNVRDGVLGVYSIYKAEDGVPEIGCFGQTTTDEDNGFEISFPVKGEDIDKFRAAAQSALQHFDPLPTIINGVVTAPAYTYRAPTWAMRAEAGPLGVIMGGIRYPVATSSLAVALKYDSRLSPLFEYGLDLWLPIGACSIAMSREALAYNDRTNAALRTAVEAVLDDVIATFATIFDGCSSRWDAMIALGEQIGYDEHSSKPRAKLLAANAQYRGAPLTLKIDTKGFRGSAWTILKRGERGYRSSFTKALWIDTAKVFSITPGRVETLIIDDLPFGPKHKAAAKIREYIESTSETKPTVCLRPGYNESVKELLAALGNPPEFVLTSDLPEPRKATRGGSKTVRPRVRMWSFNGTNDRYTKARISNLRPSLAKEEAVFEIEYSQQPATGIMVVMTNFELPSTYHQRIASGLVHHSELLFVNEGDAAKLAATWTNFDDEWRKRLQAAISAYPEMRERLAVYQNPVLKEVFEWAELIKPTALSPTQLRRPFGRISLLRQKYIAPLTSRELQLAPFVEPALPSGLNPARLLAAFKAEQSDAVILFENLNLNVQAHVDLLMKNL